MEVGHVRAAQDTVRIQTSFGKLKRNIETTSIKEYFNILKPHKCPDTVYAMLPVL